MATTLRQFACVLCVGAAFADFATSSQASLILNGDPGTVGGPPQNFAVTVPTGSLASALTDFVINFSNGKFIQPSGLSAIQLSIDVIFDGASVGGGINVSAGLGLLGQGNQQLVFIPGGGSGSLSGTQWHESSQPFSTDFASPFFGFDWIPLLDVPSTFAGRTVESGTIKVTFLPESGVVGTVPEPATLALIGLGLAGLGFARRKQ